MAAQDGQPEIQLSPLVKQMLDDDLLTESQRREAMIFHGQWEDLGELSADEHKRLAAHRYDVDLEFIEDLTTDFVALTPDNYRSFARIFLRHGKPETTLGYLEDYDGELGAVDWLLAAQAWEDLGQYPRAIQMLAPIREQVRDNFKNLNTAADLTAAAEAVIMLARLEGRPAADFHLANKLLSKARDELDPLYWPAYVAEAELLMAKGNPREAMEAVGQALSLNPKSSEAWYLFGSMRCRFFDFDAANRAVRELREINPEHPLADALAVAIALRQKDVATAQEVIGPALERYPAHRELLALHTAVQAMTYDDAAKQTALETFAKLAPGNPLAEHAVGKALSDARQYALAEPHLKRAIEMMPGWSEPQLALGELYVQWGKLDEAAAQLRAASSLDPFHKQITNQLTLVQEMLAYDVIETEQFIVRYLPGIDEVLARDVALHMGDMVEQFIERFQHDPPALTQVDLMPDDQHFAVRVTGMPDIWTIAACTGDVIAMTPPRPGPKRAYGPYNWLNVMGHEYAHVVNLSQTTNRVPHWFTEGCAVNMETTGRLWSQYQLLAECYNNDLLFEYDEINWGFIRPTEPYHRSLAYAQSAWIKEYIETTFGWDKAIAMLDLYNRGVGEHETIRRVFGTDVESFMAGFLVWAGEQVESWGMATHGVEIDDAELADILATQDATQIDSDRLEQALTNHPDEPLLLQINAKRAISGNDDALAIEAIKAYQASRPVDPWSDRQLARIALKSGDSATAIEALQKLDTIEGNTPEYAVELARVYRGQKRYDQALHFAERALLREPYNAAFRETAATIAIQKGDLRRAAFHVDSLSLIEPDRIIHPKRLVRLYELANEPEKADAARQRVKALESSERN
jgi:tetratricopeptide (TPR) repeat protein